MSALTGPEWVQAQREAARAESIARNAPWVEGIAKPMRADGYGYRAIARAVADAGYRGPSGATIDPKSVMRALRRVGLAEA